MKKIIVALRDLDSVESLIALACQMASGMDAEVIALHVNEIPLATPLDADDDLLDHPAKEILAKAKEYASKCFQKRISTQLLRARDAGEAIVGEATDQGAELLILGYHRPHGLGEILLGSTVQSVARHARCRVLIQIPPADHS